MLWELTDKTRVLVARADFPQNVPLEKAGLEEGTLNQIPGKLISSVQTSINGVPVYTIAVHGTVQGQSIFGMQKIVAFNGVCYKLMAGGTSDCSTDPRIVPVFNSFTILDPNPRVPRASTSRNPFSHARSVGIAEIGWAVLFLALLAFVIRKVMTTGAKNNTKAPSWGIAIDQRDNSVLVARVDPESPASNAGLLVGDCILRVNGSAVSNVQAVYAQFRQCPTGQPVQLDINRSGQEVGIALTPS